MAWRPHQYLLEGELDNAEPQEAVGWMKLVGLDSVVSVELKGEFHEGIHDGDIIPLWHFDGSYARRLLVYKRGRFVQTMKIDPHNHEQRCRHWQKRIRAGIPELSKANTTRNAARQPSSKTHSGPYPPLGHPPQVAEMAASPRISPVETPIFHAAANNAPVAFSTRRAGILRTVGLLCRSADRDDPSSWLRSHLPEAERLLQASQPMDEQPCALGKLCLLLPASEPDYNFTCCCFQVKDGRAAPVYCGNSTAAAAALYCSLARIDRCVFQPARSNGSVRASANVRGTAGSCSVSQRWTIRHFSEQPPVRRIDEKLAHCSLLNDYIIARGFIDSKTVPNLLQQYDLPLLEGKLVALQTTSDNTFAQFYNCNGMHGAAPHTGLATLAIAQLYVRWIRQALRRQPISTPQSKEPVIPAVLLAPWTYVVQMPEVTVHLRPIGETG